MFDIHLYGKHGCGKCDAAKEKLEKMGLSFTYHTLEYHIAGNDGWKENGDVELLAWAADQDADVKTQLPTLRIDGEYFNYSQAMKKLKELTKGKE